MAIVKGESFTDALSGYESADERLVDYLMDLCELVYDRMQELGMTRKDLAERMGVNPSRITKILSGEANVTLKTVAELDAALGLGLRLSSNGEVSRSQVVPNWMRAAVATKGRMGHDWIGGNQSRRIVNKPVNLTCFDGGMAA